MPRSAIAIAALVLAACASEPPPSTHIPLGDEVPPPAGCVDLRERSGDPDVC